MPTFIISYDAKADKDGANALGERIKKLGKSWHEVGTTVVLHSDEFTADQLYDHLRPHVGEGGKLLIIKSGVEHAAIGLDEHDAALLKQIL